ncbi:unnamed protein product [Leuciscus chuanchicus]
MQCIELQRNERNNSVSLVPENVTSDVPVVINAKTRVLNEANFLNTSTSSVRLSHLHSQAEPGYPTPPNALCSSSVEKTHMTRVFSLGTSQETPLPGCSVLEG